MLCLRAGSCRSAGERQPSWGSRSGFRRVLGDCLRETEVQDLDFVIGSDLDVRGLEVSVNNPTVVRGRQSPRHFPGECDGFVKAHGSSREALGERLSFDELEDEKVGRPGPLKTVDRGDVRMVQRR